MSGIVEIVPNFSEGRDRERVQRLADAVGSAAGVRLLDKTLDPDHHRSVITAAGPPDGVEAGLFEAAKIAVAEIDLNRHEGVHPRIGVLDVAPFVAVRDIDRERLVERARAFGRRLAEQLGLPVFFYGHAATSPETDRLEFVRREAFRAIRPDCGGPGPHPTAGAVAVGVREFLIAFNVQLATEDVRVARGIARSIRESSGGLAAVKALGLELPAEGCTQVSMNLTDYRTTPPATVVERIRDEAKRAGVGVMDGELIGLIPEAALRGTSGEELGIRNWDPDRMVFERRLAAVTATAR